MHIRIIVSLALLIAILLVVVHLAIERNLPQTKEEILFSKIYALDGMIERKTEGLSVTLTGGLVRISDPEIIEISELKEVYALRLYDTKVTKHGIEFLTSNSQLRELYLDGSQSISDDCVGLFPRMRGLQILSLRNTQVSGETIDKLRAQMTNCKIEF